MEKNVLINLTSINTVDDDSSKSLPPRVLSEALKTEALN